MIHKSDSKRFYISPTFKEILLLIFIFILALLIRSIGLKHGFPLLLHPDEGVILDLAFFKTKEGYFYPGNPGNFIRPNQILYSLNYLFLNVMSYLRFGENFAARYQLYELNFYHYARLLIAFMGAMIPVITYLIGKLFKPSFALAASFVFLVFPSYVLHSHYITPDIPITLFTLIVIYFTLRYLIKNENLSLYVAVIFAAINTAEKYPGLLSLIIIFTGILIKAFEKSDPTSKQQIRLVIKQVLTVSLVFLLTLLLVAPNLFLHFQMVKTGFLFSSRTTHAGADYLDFFGRLRFYINSFASWSNILAIFWLAAGCFALIKWRNKYTLLFFYGVFYWICLSVLSLHWERWALPMYITPLFLIAIGISFLWNRYKTIPKMKLVTVIIISLFFVQQGIAALYTSISLGYTDTRILALDYAQTNGITPENSLYEGYTPFQKRQAPKTIFSDYEDQKNDYKYIILSSRMYDRFFQEPRRYAEEVSVYERIRKNHRLLATFEPDENAECLIEQFEEIVNFIRRSLNKSAIQNYRGPIIEIYQVNK